MLDILAAKKYLNKVFEINYLLSFSKHFPKPTSWTKSCHNICVVMHDSTEYWDSQFCNLLMNFLSTILHHNTYYDYTALPIEFSYIHVGLWVYCMHKCTCIHIYIYKRNSILFIYCFIKKKTAHSQWLSNVMLISALCCIVF